MTQAHKRKKNPGVVRQSLIDHAARLALQSGMAGVTVQRVSDAAGVTKGGLMHHFPTKQALVGAVFDQLLATIDADLDDRIAADAQSYGVFTRAYIEAVFDLGLAAGGPWASLSMSWLTDPDLRQMWAGWFETRLDRHSGTDSDMPLVMARLAADGLWLADLAGISLDDRTALRAALVALTRPSPILSKR